MRILHIITRLILGGAQRNTVYSCAAQVRAGHDVGLAYGPIYGPEGSLLEEARASGAELFEVNTMRRAILPAHDARCYFALRRLIGAFGPDVVHTHSSKAGILGRAAAWDEHVPAVIHTVHGLPFHERQSRLTRGLYVRLERWAAQRCHRIIGITQAMCDAFAQQGIGRPGMFDVVPTGLDLPFFDRAAHERDRYRRKLGVNDSEPVLGIVARLDPLKGHDDLLDILPQLLRTHPRLRLVFVGDGFHRAAIDKRLAGVTWSNRVTLTGLVTPREAAAYMSAMDVMALPSYQEGQGRTLAEALLCGCAIVGYDAGGIGEVCIDGKTGRLVRTGDRTALGGAIRWLLDHPEQRRRLVENGRSLVRQRFDVRGMAQQLEQIYRQTLHAARRHG